MTGQQAPAAQGEEGSAKVARRAEALAARLTAHRRHLHAHPELAFHEYETAAYIAAQFRRLPRFRVQTGVAGTGVVAELGQASGPVVLLRADMDALPVVEDTGDPGAAFASTVPGRMHACGHDGHCAMLLGAADILHQLDEAGELGSRVRLIFQPAEEAADGDGHSGAYHLREAGVLSEVGMAWALHLNPQAPLGTMALWDGSAMASCDVFHATLMGRGGHAGYPHLAVDPLWLLGAVLPAIHQIVSRRVSPLEAAAVTVGQIAGGQAPNVIADEVELTGTLRAYSPAVRATLAEELDRALQVARALGGDYRLAIRRDEPPLRNDPRANRALAASFQRLFPTGDIVWEPFGMGGEDFAYLAERVPAALAFLGCGVPGDFRPLHSPGYAMDERVLPMGAALLAEAARAFADRGGEEATR